MQYFNINKQVQLTMTSTPYLIPEKSLTQCWMELYKAAAHVINVGLWGVHV